MSQSYGVGGTWRTACLALGYMVDDIAPQGDGKASKHSTVQLLSFFPQPYGGLKGKRRTAATHRLYHALAAAQGVDALLLPRC